MAISFEERFAPLIESGAKKQTIRADKSGRYRIGQRLDLFTGLRTKKCRRLCNGGKTAAIVATADVVLTEGKIEVSRRKCLNGFDVLDDENLCADAIARADGFGGYEEMWNWFVNKYKITSKYKPDVFHGKVISWEWF